MKVGRKGESTLTGKETITSWYRAHSDAIFKYIFLIVRDAKEAEDLTQETFIKAYLNFDSFQHRANEKTWLFRIAHNVTIDYLRKRKPLVYVKEIFTLKNRALPSAEEIVIMNERTEEFIRMLDTLKHSYRQVIILRKVHGFSTRETMEILNWSESKVKSTLSRALKVLAKQMEKKEDESRE